MLSWRKVLWERWKATHAGKANLVESEFQRVWGKENGSGEGENVSAESL